MQTQHRNYTRNEHKELRDLCDLVNSCKLLKMSDVDIAHEIIKKYGFYMPQLTYAEYVAWLRSDRKFAHIYFNTVADEAYADALRVIDVVVLTSY